jgi:phospho-N-acetylmuramoyl-pentapeptide-transferase
LSALLIVASSNAVNLTDGLDGLAAGCLVSALSAFAILAYAAGDAIPGASEVMVIAAATIGGLLGFLRFNRHPARVFMGDTGSLPLGGLLAFVAIVLRQELLLAVIGGVFVMEAASVMLQVGVYKCRQYRVFRCAPLHHHFQFKGWPEPQIVARFWLVSALLAVVGLVCASIAT